MCLKDFYVHRGEQRTDDSLLESTPMLVNKVKVCFIS